LTYCSIESRRDRRGNDRISRDSVLYRLSVRNYSRFGRIHLRNGYYKVRAIIPIKPQYADIKTIPTEPESITDEVPTSLNAPRVTIFVSSDVAPTTFIVPDDESVIVRDEIPLKYLLTPIDGTGVTDVPDHGKLIIVTRITIPFSETSLTTQF